jgi:SAM-dependent methyltransferase
MGDKERIRQTVEKAYADAISKPVGSCCAPGARQKSVAAQLAGYSEEDLDALPPEGLADSFGCGNPLALSDVREGDVVLDLGCGAGLDLLIAGKRVGPAGRAIGIDMTDAMIAKAREKIAASGLRNVEIRKGPIEDLPVESSSVNWVISNCVINLSPEKPKVFAEIARVLRPGGRMLVSDIVAQDLPDWVRQDPSLYVACVAGAISEEEYLDGLREAGLENAEVRGRLLYDASQLRAFLHCECVPGIDRGLLGDETITRLIESMTGRIWSAKIYAEKPAA